MRCRHAARRSQRPVRAARRRAPETAACTKHLPPRHSALRPIRSDTEPDAPLGRSAASVLFGCLVIVVSTTIGFGPLGGIVHRDAPLTLQAAGALVAVVSGLLGGVMAALVAGHHPVRHAVAVLLLPTIDTAVVLSRAEGSGVVRARLPRHAHAGHGR
jgi:hypothetical protein